MTATRTIRGSISLSNCSIFPPTEASKLVNPVRYPPGSNKTCALKRGHVLVPNDISRRLGRRLRPTLRFDAPHMTPIALCSGKTAKNSSLFVAPLAPSGSGAGRRRCPLCRVGGEVADDVG